MIKTLHAFVTGTVQGVFIRANTKNEAGKLGLTGWVKNLPNGKVEVEASGEEKKLKKLLKFLQNNPGRSRVENVEYEYAEEQLPYDSFEIKY